MIKKDKFILLFLVVLFGIQVIIFYPVNGNFPLNDDWVHSLSIKIFSEKGEFFYPSFLGPYNLIPTIFGILLSKFFGFSFLILKYFNSILSLGCILLFYCFLRKIKVSIIISLLITLLFLSNPVFFNLSYTFMGDIMALFLIILAIYLYYLGFEKKKYWMIFLASIVVVLASFTRQVCFLLFLAAFIFYFFNKRFKRINFLWVFGVPAIIGLFFYILLNNFGVLPSEISARFLPEGWSYFEHIIYMLWDYLLLISLFIVPITLSLVIKNLGWLKKYLFWFLVVLFFSFAIIFKQEGHVFPSLGNIINFYGLGPNASVMQGSLQTWFGEKFYIILHYILSILSAINIFIVVQFIKIKNKKIKNLNFIWLFLLLYILIVLPIRSFDRYLVLVLPSIFLFSSLILKKFKSSKIIFILFLFLLLFYSFVGTYNYLAWNKARWALGERLLKNKGVEISEIEGGYEWDGWFLYKKTREENLGDFTPEWSPWYIKQLFSGHTMKYIISFSELGGYKIIDKEKVNGIFSNIGYIYLNEVVPYSLK